MATTPDLLLNALDKDLKKLEDELNWITANGIHADDTPLLVQYIKAVDQDLHNLENSSSPYDQQIVASTAFIAIKNMIEQPIVSKLPSLISAASEANPQDLVQLLQYLIFAQQGGSSLIALDVILPIGQFLLAWPPSINPTVVASPNSKFEADRGIFGWRVNN